MASNTIGISYPLTLTFDNVSSTTLQAARANLLSLLSTNQGERYMEPTLGSPRTVLYKHLFEGITDDSLGTLQAELEDAITFWLPYVVIKDITVESTNEMKDRYQINLKIDFSLKNNPTIFDSIQVSL